MSELLLTNVFFAITSIAVVVVTAVFVLVLLQVLKILRKLENILRQVQHGAERVVEDVAAFKREFVTGGLIMRIIGHILNIDMYNREHHWDEEDRAPKGPAHKKTRKKAKKRIIEKE